MQAGGAIKIRAGVAVGMVEESGIWLWSLSGVGIVEV